jgi:hypothetical protein
VNGVRCQYVSPVTETDGIGLLIIHPINFAIVINIKRHQSISRSPVKVLLELRVISNFEQSLS